jgi:Mg-chelatase subunit ChlD
MLKRSFWGLFAAIWLLSGVALSGTGLQSFAAAPPTPGDRLEAVLARGITDAYEPRDVARDFAEDVEKIHLVVKAAGEPVSLRATWIAVNAEGYAANHTLLQSSLSLRAGQRGALWIGAPRGGFGPGDYRVDLAAGGAPALSLPFKVVPTLPPAALADATAVPSGHNLALAALGGKIEQATSAYDGSWAATNLIDGVPFLREGRGCRSTCGWSSKDATSPQEIVLSFYQGREATITAIVVDTTTAETITRYDRMAKHIEVWTSVSGAASGFSRVAGARLHPRPTEQIITLPPTRARFVKLRLLSNRGGSYTQLGEVKVIEARDGPSILAGAPKNLALPALGGTVVRFTARRQHGLLSRLVDGRDPESSWQSGDGPYGPASYLPQEFVFAFRGDQTALIERVVLASAKRDDPATWPKVVTVAVSTESPIDGFREIRRATLSQTPGEQTLAIGDRARFLKLRVLQNYGGRYTSLGQVKILEGTAPGYESVLLTNAAQTAAAMGAAAQADEPGIGLEKEPNNTPAEANPLELGRRTKGTIDPLGESDTYRLTIPGAGPSVLTVELMGRPNIRTSLSLQDATGKPLARFDPGRIPSQRTVFSWQVQPGDHLLQVTEPPISLVMIWDTSGSMGADDVKNLREAMEAYLDQVRPGDRLNLIRFSGAPTEPNAVEVLLPEFTDNRERLKSATSGKFFANGGTPFYDAVEKGISLLSGMQGNRAIVVMTDGADTTSRLDHAGFWRVLEEKRIRLYTVGLGSELKTYEQTIGTTGSGVLNHAALATNGRFFFARTAEELKGYYQQIADELRTTSTYYLRATVSQGPGGLAVAATGERIAAVSAPSQIELILDGSGSMKRRLGGRMMIDIAKDVMSQIIRELPDDARVALRLYGHRIREGRPGDCRDTELAFPFGKIDKAKMLAKVRSIAALGTTPIAYTLQQVARDFGATPGEKLVILVTDGKEECKGDPAAAVAGLQAKGLKVRLNVVGFALADAATKRDMERVAAMTGGKFFDAQNAKALTQAIQQALAVPYDVVDAAGTRVGTGVTGQDRIALPEGVYTIIVRASGTPIFVPDVRIAPGGFTKVVLRKEGQEVGIQVQGP